MSQSHVKKITSEMISLEKESIKFVPSDHYYFVKVNLNRGNYKEDDDIKRKFPQGELSPLYFSHLAESLLELIPKPIIVYYTDNLIMMLFSCEGDGDVINTREFDGNHNLIVSKYVSFFIKQLSSARLSHDEEIPEINVSIVHIDTQTKIFTYLSWIIFQVSQNKMIELSKGKITSKEIQFRTDSELKVILSKQGVKWDELDPHIKYGTILRCKHKKSGDSILRMSELMDARDTKKYLTFLFGA